MRTYACVVNNYPFKTKLGSIQPKKMHALQEKAVTSACAYVQTWDKMKCSPVLCVHDP